MPPSIPYQVLGHQTSSFTLMDQQSGIANGGSAAIITTGLASNPTRISSISETGRWWTSSFETEGKTEHNGLGEIGTPTFLKPEKKSVRLPVSHRWKNRKCFSIMGKEEEVKLGFDQVSREMFVKWHPPPWSWNANPSWTVRISLSGGSSKRHSDKELLIDAINTITEVGTHEYAIYTDGSAERGFKNGGSAAIATTGPASEPTIVHSSSRKGNSLTSSFETEVMALLLATEWLADQ